MVFSGVGVQRVIPKWAPHSKSRFQCFNEGRKPEKVLGTTGRRPLDRPTRRSIHIRPGAKDLEDRSIIQPNDYTLPLLADQRQRLAEKGMVRTYNCDAIRGVGKTGFVRIV